MQRLSRYATAAALLISTAAAVRVTAQEDAGNFVLYKAAHSIGQETYSIRRDGEQYTLTSDFLFKDRNTPVPLKTTFTARSRDMRPLHYQAEGRASRLSPMQDALEIQGDTLHVTRTGKATTAQAPVTPWFVTDGYSPVSMQEQMMRWWLLSGRPATFTVFPANATVRITPASTLTVGGMPLQGYTVSGLIWGEESLWLDANTNLAALVSTDAEFDHFEAVRQPYAEHLGEFIAGAVSAELADLERLSATVRMRPARVLAITGATLIDSTGAPAVPDSVIVIRDGIIAAAGPRTQVHVPRGATVLDARGKFAIPGLWDAHAHYEQVEWGPVYLAAGVTSVRDVGNEFDFIRSLHDALDRPTNPAIGPHLEFAGIIDGSGPMQLGAITADSPEQAVADVRRYKAAGARQIKIYSSVKPEVVKAICAEAHAEGLTVTGHIPNGMTAAEGIAAGMDQINHIQYVLRPFLHTVNGPDGKPDRSQTTVDPGSPQAKELLALLKQHGTVLDPTLALYETRDNTVPLDQLEPGVDHLPPQLREALDSQPPADEAGRKLAEVRNRATEAPLRYIHAAGIPVIAGTDQGIPGYSLHRELELYVGQGFTPLEALQSATIVTARASGAERESGSLTPGKRGDVTLLDADPLQDIHNTRKVWRTVAAGAVYDPGALWASVGFLP